MDPAQFARGLMAMGPVMIPDPTKPRNLKFECADCGKLRRGSERYRCPICAAHICGWCEAHHGRQHPKESA